MSHFFSHDAPYIRDLTWQLFYRFVFEKPPAIEIEPNLRDDKWIMFLERTWWLQQLWLAVPLYLLGGIPWLVWGIGVRVIISIIGHWTVTYICHNPGPQSWHVKGAAVQASNLRFAGFITHGECWHNNHHAFPESARIGLEKGQIDPAWAVIKFLGTIGLAHNIGHPRDTSQRDDLIQVT